MAPPVYESQKVTGSSRSCPSSSKDFQQLVSARKNRSEERRQLKQQLEDMQKQLRQLQEKFYQIYDSTDSENDEDGNLSEDSMRSEILGQGPGLGGRSDNEMCELDPGQFIGRAGPDPGAGNDENKPSEGSHKDRDPGPNSLQPEGKHLAETLKQELNTAMSQVVDTVVKVFSAKPSHQVPQVFPTAADPPGQVCSQRGEPLPTPPTSACSALAMSSFESPGHLRRVQMPGSTDQRKPCPWWSAKTPRTSLPPAPPAATTSPCISRPCRPPRASPRPPSATPSHSP